MISMEWEFFAVLIFTFLTIGLVVGTLLQQSFEDSKHREVCPCKWCTHWRKRRDAEKEFKEKP